MIVQTDLSSTELVSTLEQDYSDEVGPFDPSDFPENRISEQVADEHMPGVLTYFVMLDYNRSADMLVDNILELYDDDPRWFDSTQMARVDADELSEVFADIGFRYPNRDSLAWVDNSVTIADRFGGIRAMVQEADHSAPKLVELLREHEIKYLQGAKLAPFYARVVHQYVAPLDDTHELPIPVDTHIRRLSTDIMQRRARLCRKVTDDDIRQFWTEVSAEADTNALTVDRYLWMIGYNWKSGGEDYWEQLMQKI